MSKKETRQEIVNYLCGEEGLKEEFIDLLEQGGLSEEDGYEIKEKLLSKVDSNLDLNLIFIDSFDNKKFSMKKLDKYTNDEEYMELVKKQYPQSVDEAVDILIEEMDKEAINRAKKSDKYEFTGMEHFGLGLYARNHLGLNNGEGAELNHDLITRKGDLLLFPDDASGFLMEELWERIQKDYDEIIIAKE